MKIAKAKGRLRGKQPKLNPRQEAHLMTLHRAGEHSTTELADLFGVARSTVYWGRGDGLDRRSGSWACRRP
jgi:DNA invertase Pin-like site-specific DNA recombinase